MARKPKLKGLEPRLSYANVMVTLLAFVVLGGGGAYALSHNTSKPQRADLAVSVSGPASLQVSGPAGTGLPSSDTVTVLNKGPGRTRPIVFVSVPGHTLTDYDNAGDNDQSTRLGSSFDPAHSSPSCIPLGPAGQISQPFNTTADANTSGGAVCEGPIMGKGKTTSFQIAYVNYPCAGDYSLTTSALVISAVLDPKSANDAGSHTTSVSTTGCG